MKIVGIIGPFRASTWYDIKANIQRAEALALEVWKLGAVAICPHLNTANFQGLLPDKTWLEGYKAVLRRCDAAITVDGWERSSGSRDEVEAAHAAGIPVFLDLDSLAWFLETGMALPTEKERQTHD